MGFNTCILTLLELVDATLLKKMGPFELWCVKRHEIAVQREPINCQLVILGITVCVLLNSITLGPNVLKNDTVCSV